MEVLYETLRCFNGEIKARVQCKIKAKQGREEVSFKESINRQWSPLLLIHLPLPFLPVLSVCLLHLLKVRCLTRLTVTVELLKSTFCGLVLRVHGHRSGGPGSIPGATRFSEKQNGVHSAS
jgi:hypothetical protein